MNEYDSHETYCRALGDCIHFSYCRAAGGREPCSRILDCWAGRLPVVEFLRKNYSPQVLERVFAPSPGRLERIVDIAERLGRNSTVRPADS